MGHNKVTGALEPLDFNHLVDNVPEFRLIPTEVDTYQFDPPIDSSDMTPQRWAQLVNIVSERYDDYDGFVILHGTDTMAFTASALSFMFENLTKPRTCICSSCRWDANGAGGVHLFQWTSAAWQPLNEAEC